MSLAAALAAPRDRPGPLEVYRDDGPLARALGSTLGNVIRLPPVALLLIGALPFLALLAIGGDDASTLTVGVALAWLVLCGGISSGRPHRDPLRWTAPPLLRLVEYAGIIWFAAIEGLSAPPAAFALLAAVAFRHYDLVYRLRYQGVTTPRWIDDLGGGWEGRLVVGYLLLVAGALPAGFFVEAAVLATVFVGESIAGWTRFTRTQAVGVYEDEEEEGL
jgi:hypothetical protein